MKKVLMSVALMSAIAIAAGYSMIGSNESEMNVSDLTSANVEALGQALPKEYDCKPGGIDCNLFVSNPWGKRLVEKDQ